MRVAYERSEGKKTKTFGIEFGEAILWKNIVRRTFWEAGFDVAGQYFMESVAGLDKARSVQMKPVGGCWNSESASW